MNDDLEQLAALCKNGDMHALEALIAAFHPFLVAKLRLRGIPDSDLDDIAQKVTMRVYRSLGHYDASRPFLPWLHVIIVNMCANYWRDREREQRRRHGLRQYLLRRLEEQHELVSDDEYNRLQECLQSLPPSQQEMIRLRYEQSLGHGDIAAACGKSVVAVRKALSRIRQHLAMCIRAESRT